MSEEKNIKTVKEEEKIEKRKKEKKKVKNNNDKRTRSRSLVSGNYSMAITIVFLAILVLINVIVCTIPPKYTQFDVSATDVFTLTDTTKEFLKTLDEDITFYEIAEIQNENDYVKNVVQAYVNESKHIKFERIDPALQPEFLENLKVSVNQGSIIVKKGDRFKACEITGMFLEEKDTDSSSGNSNQEEETQDKVNRIDIEGQLTGAIAYVNVETLPVAYQLTGHEEGSIGSNQLLEINKQAMDVKTLNLQEEGKLPEDIAMLIINGMQSDFTDEEYNIIKAYLEEGGRLLWLTSNSYPGETDMSNYHKLMRQYGVDTKECAVIEQDTAYMKDSSRPMEIYPVLKRHPITNPANDAELKAMFAMADAIEILEDSQREGLEIESVIQSSSSAYAKKKGSSVMAKLVTDEEGVFHLGVAITDKKTNEKTAKIALISTYTITADTYDEMVNGGDTQILIGALSWLADQEVKTEVPIKNLYPADLVLTQKQITRTTVVVVIILPVVILAYGLIVMIRRRKS